MFEHNKKRKSKKIFNFSICLFLIAMNLPAPNLSAQTMDPLDVARGLIGRVLPGSEYDFDLEIIAAQNGKDVFEIETVSNRPVLRGNNVGSIAFALNWYLKYHTASQISRNGDQISLPNPLPNVSPKFRKVTPYEYRYNFNYCTFNYTMSFWDWERWEREIDYMALNGVNMPLAITGQESIWLDVYTDMGLSASEVRKWLSGPGFFAWSYMGNLDSWGGPLPQSWIDSHRVLQQQILKRQRELGMKPVLPAFTGHVPENLISHYPSADISQMGGWVNFPGTYLLNPSDPLFNEIAVRFLNRQEEVYGTDHLYSSDTFNENPVPATAQEIWNVSSSIFNGMISADPDAVWVMQGWMFLYASNEWTSEKFNALLDPIPNDRMIILDLWSERFPVWQERDSYRGKKWVWNMLHNFGGNTYFGGPMQIIASTPPNVLNNPDSGNMVGVGVTCEAFWGNNILYDLMFEMGWNDSPVDLNDWVPKYVTRRYGESIPAVQSAWDTIYNNYYRTGGSSETDYWSIIKSDMFSRGVFFKEDIYNALGELLSVKDRLSSVDTYRYDLTDLGRLLISSTSRDFLHGIRNGYYSGNRAEVELWGNRALEALDDMDRLMGTREEWLFGKWLADARSWGMTTAEKDLMEWNARQLVTRWDSYGYLRDYAKRQESGLMKGFYKERWIRFLDELYYAIDNGVDWNYANYLNNVNSFELAWIETNDSQNYPSAPIGDSVVIAQEIYDKYGEMFNLQAEPNIALGMPATASSSLAEFPPENANDTDSGGSYWGTDSHPAWWQVDLLDTYQVTKVIITNYVDGSRYYQYDIQASVDGTNWTQIAAKTNTNVAVDAGDSYDVGVNTRYLRVNMAYNSANSGVHIRNFRVTGTLGESTPNIARGKPAIASGSSLVFTPENANDTDSSESYWGGDPYPAWWQVDLLDTYWVTKVTITNYVDGLRYYQYDIQASVDGTNWTQIAAKTNTNVAVDAGDSYDVVVNTRYLRVNMTYNSANSGVHIRNFRVTGTLGESTPNVAFGKPTTAQIDEGVNHLASKSQR